MRTGLSWKKYASSNKSKYSQKHLNFKIFRPTISDRRRERAGSLGAKRLVEFRFQQISLVEKSAKRKVVDPTEQKQKLMAKCIDVLDRPKEAGDQFALYVSEQLKNFR